MNVSKQIKRITRDMDKLALDVSEVRIAADAEYQSDRLYSISKRLKRLAESIDENPSTQIHGGGTGKD